MSDLTTLHANRLWITACRLARLTYELAEDAFADDLFLQDTMQNIAVCLPVRIAEAHEAATGEMRRVCLSVAQESLWELSHYIFLSDRQDKVSPLLLEETVTLYDELDTALADAKAQGRLSVA